LRPSKLSETIGYLRVWLMKVVCSVLLIFIRLCSGRALVDETAPCPTSWKILRQFSGRKKQQVAREMRANDDDGQRGSVYDWWDANIELLLTKSSPDRVWRSRKTNATIFRAPWSARERPWPSTVRVARCVWVEPGVWGGYSRPPSSGRRPWYLSPAPSQWDHWSLAAAARRMRLMRASRTRSC